MQYLTLRNTAEPVLLKVNVDDGSLSSVARDIAQRAAELIEVLFDLITLILSGRSCVH